MPYITQHRRDALDSPRRQIETAGELNYLLTSLGVDYLVKHGLSYSTINDVLGALEGAKQEFYRRVAVPYEDGKMEINGDVYDGFAP